MPSSPSEKLFSGTPIAFGGLSNEKELAEICPDEFKKNNPWSTLAMNLFFEGGKIGHWKFKSSDRATCGRQLSCFSALLGTFDIPHEDKEAVAGWMLSEMLQELPEYICK